MECHGLKSMRPSLWLISLLRFVISSDHNSIFYFFELKSESKLELTLYCHLLSHLRGKGRLGSHSLESAPLYKEDGAQGS